MQIFGVGIPELLLVLIVTLVVVGPQRLPEMAGRLGRFVRQLRRYASQVTREISEGFAELTEEYQQTREEFRIVRSDLEEGSRSLGSELHGTAGELRREARAATLETAGRPGTSGATPPGRGGASRSVALPEEEGESGAPRQGEPPASRPR